MVTFIAAAVGAIGAILLSNKAENDEGNLGGCLLVYMKKCHTAKTFILVRVRPGLLLLYCIRLHDTGLNYSKQYKNCDAVQLPEQTHIGMTCTCTRYIT